MNNVCLGSTYTEYMKKVKILKKIFSEQRWVNPFNPIVAYTQQGSRLCLFLSGEPCPRGFSILTIPFKLGVLQHQVERKKSFKIIFVKYLLWIYFQSSF